MEFLVLISLPKMLMELIVFQCLGHSRILRASQCKDISIPELYHAFTYNSVLANEVYQKLDLNRDGFLGHETLRGVLAEVFGRELQAGSPEDADKHLDKLTETVIHYYNGVGDVDTDLVRWRRKPKHEEGKHIAKADFLDAMLAQGIGKEVKDILWDDMIGRCEQSTSKQGLLDMLMPRGLRRRMKRDACTPVVEPAEAAEEVAEPVEAAVSFVRHFTQGYPLTYREVFRYARKPFFQRTRVGVRLEGLLGTKRDITPRRRGATAFAQ